MLPDRKGFHRKSALTGRGLTNFVQNLTNKLKILIVLSRAGSLHEVSIKFKVKPPAKCIRQVNNTPFILIHSKSNIKKKRLKYV